MQTIRTVVHRFRHRDTEVQSSPPMQSYPSHAGGIVSSTAMDVDTPQAYSGFNFPPELDDQLMYIMSEDHALLKTCALVSRAWLAASRVYLFRDVTIENEAMFRRFEEVVVNSPMIQNCVKVLRIDRQSRKYELTFPWVNNNLSPILPGQLTALHTFELNSVEERWKEPSFRNLSFFRTVTKLSLIRCSSSTEELCGVISAFPSIKELRISAFIELFNRREIVVPFLHKFEFVEKLTLHCDDIPVISRDGSNLIDFLMNRGCKDSLKSVDVAVSQLNVKEVGQLIRSLGDKLEDLRINFIRRFGFYETSLQELLDHLDFSQNKRLKRLTLADPANLATRTLLSRVASPHISIIAFAYRIYDLKSISRANPELLTQTLTAPNLSHLAEVQFRYWDHQQLEGVENAFQEAFVQLHKKGVLRVVRDRTVA